MQNKDLTVHLRRDVREEKQTLSVQAVNSSIS